MKFNKIPAIIAVGVLSVIAGSNLVFASSTEEISEPTLVQRDVCFGEEQAEIPTSTNANETVVSVVVDPMTTVQMDESGEIVAVATNTGCVPREKDIFAVVSFDGYVDQADEALKAAVLEKQDWTGDWTDTKAWHHF